MDYNFVIVGGGVAGLYCGVELLKRKPKPTVCILESYKKVGGRISTHRDTQHGIKFQWENGAGRVSESHEMVKDLMKRYDLHKAPIGNGATNWYEGPNPFFSLIPTYLAPLLALPEETLKKTTVAKLLDEMHGPTKAKEFALLFPYWAEMQVLRADLALKEFLEIFGGKEEFFVIKEGYQAITDGLAKEFREAGGIIQLDCLVEDVKEIPQGVHILLKDGELHGDRCILAVPSSSLKILPSIAPKMPALKHIVMCPLLRLYAVFPVHKGHSWFSDLHSTVVGNKLRYIIPVNSAKGIIMISYTDGEDAFQWIRVLEKKGIKELERQIMDLIHQTFPHRKIPKPTQFKAYPWMHGCSYWTSGNYDLATTLEKSYQISPKIYACGESLSLKQAWVESALESATNLLKRV